MKTERINGIVMLLSLTKARLEISKKFVEAKFDKSKAVLDFLSQRYPEIKFDVSDELVKLRSVKSIREILGVEGTLASKYWIEFSKAVPKEYNICNRIDQFRRAMGSGDMVNTMLNYGYSLLESECLRACLKIKLDPTNGIGLMHLNRKTVAFNVYCTLFYTSSA